MRSARRRRRGRAPDAHPATGPPPRPTRRHRAARGCRGGRVRGWAVPPGESHGRLADTPQLVDVGEGGCVGGGCQLGEAPAAARRRPPPPPCWGGGRAAAPRGRRCRHRCHPQRRPAPYRERMTAAVVATTADSDGGPGPAGERGSPTPAAAAAGWHRRCTAAAVARVTAPPPHLGHDSIESFSRIDCGMFVEWLWDRISGWPAVSADPVQIPPQSCLDF